MPQATNGPTIFLHSSERAQDVPDLLQSALSLHRMPVVGQPSAGLEQYNDVLLLRCRNIHKVKRSEVLSISGPSDDDTRAPRDTLRRYLTDLYLGHSLAVLTQAGRIQGLLQEVTNDELILRMDDGNTRHLPLYVVISIGRNSS